MGKTIPGMCLNREIITTKLRSDGTSTTILSLWRSWTINIALRAGSAVLKGRKRAEYNGHDRATTFSLICIHTLGYTLYVRIDRFVYSIRMSLSSTLCETITGKFNPNFTELRRIDCLLKVYMFPNMWTNCCLQRIICFVVVSFVATRN